MNYSFYNSTFIACGILSIKRKYAKNTFHFKSRSLVLSNQLAEVSYSSCIIITTFSDFVRKLLVIDINAPTLQTFDTLIDFRFWINKNVNSITPNGLCWWKMVEAILKAIPVERNQFQLLLYFYLFNFICHLFRSIPFVALGITWTQAHTDHVSDFEIQLRLCCWDKLHAPESKTKLTHFGCFSLGSIHLPQWLLVSQYFWYFITLSCFYKRISYSFIVVSSELSVVILNPN